jgi:hypothetical protein
MKVSPRPDKPINYEVELTHDTKLRVRIERPSGSTELISVQLEFDPGGEDWRPVRRYDNWHEGLHVDVYDFHGNIIQHHKKTFLTDDLDMALEWATEDFEGNVDRYVSEFLGTRRRKPLTEGATVSL